MNAPDRRRAPHTRPPHRQRGRSPVLLALALLALAPPPQTRAAGTTRDLIETGRLWRQERGMAAARDRMAAAILRHDHDGGSLERRVLAANADKTRPRLDSVAAIAPTDRSKVGIFLVLGYLHRNSRSRPMIETATVELRRLGYRAEILPLPPRATVASDADAILASLRSRLPDVERAILVGFSKGAAAISQFLLERPTELPTASRAKLRAVITVAGAVRGSSFARWAEGAGGCEAAFLKAFINVKTLAPLARFDDLRSLREDPWEHHASIRLRAHFPHLRWIAVPVLPDGPDGSVHSSAPFGWLSRSAARDLPSLGPNDGLVESAASIPPPGLDIPLHIVRVWGSHATLDGRYVTGAPVAPSYPRPGSRGRRAGIEFLDDLLRALPRAWILP